MTPNPTPDPEDDTIRSKDDLAEALPDLPIFEVTEMPNLVELIEKWNREYEKENPETD